MELTLLIILAIIVIAAICEFIDSSMGMLYGTILSPVLIIAGFNPLIVVPSILLSQAAGGIIASALHHRLKNSEFNFQPHQLKTVPSIVLTNLAIFRVKDEFKKTGFSEILRKGLSKDLRATLCITLLGVIATVLSVLVAVNIPKAALTTYIGILVLVMGIILLSKINFKYTWKKILSVGLLSSFNKGLSGGGFGPVTTAGQIIAGRDGKSSVGVTTLAEAPICITGFLTYFFTKGLTSWHLPFYLLIGASIGALIGPYFTARFKNDRKLRKILGAIVVLLGMWTIANTWLL